VAELAPLLRTLFDGPEPLLDRAGLSSLHAAPGQRYWRLQDLQSLLERAAMDSPLLIFLDDVQWVDSGTVAALRALPPRLASLPIGWVLAMRPDQGPGHLRSAVEYLVDEGAEKLVLEPLSQAAVAQVASDVMQAEPDETLLLMAGEAGGNPFLLVELLEGLRQEGIVRVDSGRATVTARRLPDRVRASMRERLARVSDSARLLATVPGSLGRTFSFSDLATMVERCEPVRAGLMNAGRLKSYVTGAENGQARHSGHRSAHRHRPRHRRRLRQEGREGGRCRSA
jgi:predicted ATPase